MRPGLRAVLVGLLVWACLVAVPGAASATLYPGPNGPKDVHGAIEQEWLRLRTSPGQPLTDETPTRRPGAFNAFERGSIYWSAPTGAHLVQGSFYGLWAGYDWEAGWLGFPVTNERPAGRRGVYQVFEGATLYWSPGTAASGPHSVRGAFYELWRSTGYENGYLGYPLSEELPALGGVFQRYQGGTLYWSASTGAHAVHGAFYDRWAAQGWERGPLGYPTTDEIPTSVGVRQEFQGGSLTWKASDGQVRSGKAVYANCTDVWNTIESPIYRGELGYSFDLDRDRDGTGCEVDPRR